MPTIVTKTVKPGGGGDYTSLAAAFAGEAAGANRDCTGLDQILRFELYANGTTGHPITAGMLLQYSSTAASGFFRTDRTRYIWVDVAPADAHTGAFNAAKAKLKKATATAFTDFFLFQGDVDFRCTGLQIEWTNSSSTENVTLFNPGAGTAKHARYYEVDRCLVQCTGTYNSAARLVFLEDGYSDFELLNVTNNVGNGVVVGYYLSEQQAPQIGERTIANNTFDVNGDDTSGAFFMGAGAFQGRLSLLNNIATGKATRTNRLYAGWDVTGGPPAGWLYAGNVSGGTVAENYSNASQFIELATVTYTDRTNGDLSLAAGDASGAKTCGVAVPATLFIATPWRHDATGTTMRRPSPWSAGAIQYGGEGTGAQVSAIGKVATTLSGNIDVPYPAFIAADVAAGSSDVALIIELGAGDAVTSTLSGWTLLANNTNGSLRTEIWGKAAVGTETGTVTITRASGGVCEARMYTARGVNASAPLDAAVATPVATASTTALSFSTLTTLATNARVQALVAVASLATPIDAAPSGGSLTWGRHTPYAPHDPRARVVYKFGSNNNADPNTATFTTISQPVRIPVPAYAQAGDTLVTIINIRSRTITLTATGLTQGGTDQGEMTTSPTTTTRFYDKVLTTSDVFGGYITVTLSATGWWTAQTAILRNVNARGALAQGFNGTTNGATSQTAWTFPSVVISANAVLLLLAGGDVRITRQASKTAGQTMGGTATFIAQDWQTSGDGAYIGSGAAGCASATSTFFNNCSLSYYTAPTAQTIAPTITMATASRGATFAAVYPPTSTATIGVGLLSATGGQKATAGAVSGVATGTFSSSAVKTGLLYSLAPASAGASAAGAVAGAAASSGALQVVGAGAASGIVTAAAALALVIGGAVASATTPTAALALSMGGTTVGSVASTGALQDRIGGSIAGTSTVTGAVANASSLAGAVAGTTAPTGALADSIAGTALGVVSPSGALRLILAGAATGTAAPTGSVAKAGQAAGVAIGTTTPAGALSVVAGGASAGATTPTGAAVNNPPAAGQSAGTTAPAGAVQVVAGGSVTGGTTATGAVVASAAPAGAISGATGATGALRLVVAGAVASAAAPTGLVSSGLTVTPPAVGVSFGQRAAVLRRGQFRPASVGVATPPVLAGAVLGQTMLSGTAFGAFTDGPASLPVIVTVVESYPEALRTIVARTTSEVQAAYNTAQEGDHIVMPPGTTITGRVVVPYGTRNVTLRTNRTAPVAPGTRAGPTASAGAARFVMPDVQGCLHVQPACEGLTFRDVEFTTASGAGFAYWLVNLLAATGSDLETIRTLFDRVLVRGIPTNAIKKGLVLNGGSTRVVDSWAAGFFATDTGDAQAITGWSGSGQIEIANTFMSAGTEVLAFGGADPSVTGRYPRNVWVHHCHLWKGLTGAFEHGGPGQVGLNKNLFETKGISEFLMEHCILENQEFGDDNQNYAATLKQAPYGDPTTQRTKNLTLRHNWWKNCGGGYAFGAAEARPSQVGIVDTQIAEALNRISIHNELWTGRPRFTGSGKMFSVSMSKQLTKHLADVTIDHITALPGNSTGDTSMLLFAESDELADRFVVKNSVLPKERYGRTIGGAAAGLGGGATFTGNLEYDSLNNVNPFVDTAGRVADAYANSVTTTDGQRVGCDVDAVLAGIAGVAGTELGPT